jgi:hypothetical protein
MHHELVKLHQIFLQAAVYRNDGQYRKISRRVKSGYKKQQKVATTNFGVTQDEPRWTEP